jgi:hypothetical protein
MNFRFSATAAILAASLIASYAYAGEDTKPAKKPIAAKKAKTPPPPTVQEQIQTLRQALQNQSTQIEYLKTGMADKDAVLKKALQAAADAQASADKANAAAAMQQNAASDNAAAVSTLQTTVTGLKGNQARLVSTVSDQVVKIKKDIDNPTALHYRGITLTPGGFVAGETVYRTKATGGDITTSFNSLPYEGADAYSLSEFYGSGRQTRISLLLEGKVPWGTVRGYYEADFLGVGANSNGNQSNSYVLRDRVLYAEAETNNHWRFTGGQLWTLAAENKKSITSAPENIATPQNIDPSFVVGFVYNREYGFNIVKSFNKAAFGLSIESPQLLYSASLAGNTPYAVLGSAGNNGGAYNAAISSCTPATSIVNYTNQVDTTSGGQTVNVAVPVYKTVNSCANLATVSFNEAPDVVMKAAFDSAWAHYEIFGIAGFSHETVYPGETTNSNLYGGNKDIVTGAVVAPALTSAGSVYDSIVLGGLGASARFLIEKKLTLGAKGLFGPGMGRYGESSLPDVTANAWGGIEAIHNASVLLTTEFRPTPRLTLWADYGGDYAGREDFANSATTTLAAPTATKSTAGLWGGHWAAPSAAAVGYGSRTLNNSTCSATANPGYNGSSTGYYTGASCGAQTRDVQEGTGGYWYDIYKGDRGRLRQGVQYGYVVREGWSGAGGIGAKGIDNMVLTSFRYYLP